MPSIDLAIFSQCFPGTNLNDVNLDWIILKLIDLKQRVEALENEHP